jgi:hypothetical protein
MPIYDLLDKKKYVSENERQRRIGLCIKCPKRTKWGTCKLCNCICAVKVKIKTEKCPDKPPKW